MKHNIESNKIFSFLNPYKNPNMRLFIIAILIRLTSLLLITLFTPYSLTELSTRYDSDSYLAITSSFPAPYKAPSMLPNAKHYPLLPFFIFITNIFFNHFIFSAHFVVLVAGSIVVVIFYNIAKKYSDKAYELALLFSCFPPKWLHVSTLIFSEPVFMVFLLLGILFILKERYWLAFASLGLAGIGRPVGIVFLASFVAYSFVKERKISITITGLSLGLTPFILFHLYLYSQFNRLLLFAHSKGFGGKIFSFPFDGLFEGLFDPNMIILRKLYTPLIFIFYFLSFFVCLTKLRKSRYLLITLWYLPYFIFISFIKGESINWWFISSPRLLLPIAPAALLLLDQYVSKERLQALFYLAMLLGLAYTIGTTFLN
jgi:hypothetical protein